MQSVADRFTRVASGYDRLNRILSFGLDVIWRRRAVGCLENALGNRRNDDVAILDLATGTADFAIAAARRFPRARVVGVDLTPAMLELAARKVMAARLAGRIELLSGDAAALPYGDEMFDAALCAFGFRNFADRNMSLCGLSRVLKEGGHLVVLEFFRPRSRLLGGATATWLKIAASVFARAAAEDYAYLRSSISGTCSEQEFVAEATQAGFVLERKSLFLPACSCILLRKYGKMQKTFGDR